MATGGYVGKILYVNLTDGTTKEIDTAQYEQFGGGHGIASALFFDLVEDKAISAYDPNNLITVMSSPFSGTLTPSASGRTEMTGIGSYSYPVEWYTRSNFGGRFGAMMKYAGWDGIAVQGKSETPVWINVVNGKVTIEDASGLWGMTTSETQEEIWKTVSGSDDVRDWYALATTRDSGRSAQKPAVCCIGPAGENMNRNATVQHDAGNAAGQGGFGGVWGSKNLKAISFIGTGSVEIADPALLMQLRMQMQEVSAYNVDDPVLETPVPSLGMFGIMTKQPGYGGLLWGPTASSRPQGCMGCYKCCQVTFDTGIGNGDICTESLFFMAATDFNEQMKAAYGLDEAGINAYDVFNHAYLYGLYKQGILGPGMQIESNLPWEQYGTLAFMEAFTDCIANGTDIGADLKEGIQRATMKWGRWDIDSSSGALKYPYWGYMEHYEPRVEVEWSYGTIFGDRDTNEHSFNWDLHWMPLVTSALGMEPLISAEEMVNIWASKSGLGDPAVFDYSEEGIYSDGMIKVAAWQRHHTRFWIQSLLLCDWAWPNFVNYAGEHEGLSPSMELGLYKAVTGNDLTFEESVEMGRRIWNLDRAIWVLQGRHRDQEVFANYVYDTKTEAAHQMPMLENGEWVYGTGIGRSIDRDKFEDFKGRFYAYEGWDSSTGWPLRATLEDLDLGFVADALDTKGLLGG